MDQLLCHYNSERRLTVLLIWDIVRTMQAQPLALIIHLMARIVEIYLHNYWIGKKKHGKWAVNESRVHVGLLNNCHAIYYDLYTLSAS